MDHPSHFHHQHQHQHQHPRYAPFPPHHPRHSQFPEDPRLRPHHLPPPPPPPAAPALPPPPPVLSYRNIRTPPPPHPHPYNPPHQSQFSFNAPNYAHRPAEEERPVSANVPHDFAHSQRVSNRMIVDDDRPRHSLPDFDRSNPENRIGVWNPPRVLSDNRPSRAYPPVDFDRELHHQHQLNHKIAAPYPPIDKLRYDSEGSSRVRVDHIDGYEVKAREEFAWGRGDDRYHRRGDFIPNLDKSSGEFGIMTSQSTLTRDIQLYGVERDSEISRGSRRDGLGDSKRWVNDRKAPRDPHSSSFELGNNENGAGDGIRVTSGKYYGSEMGRYNNRGNRDPAHEYIRAPKKQIQKKSALLRIQKPNYRNREVEPLHYTSYADDSDSNSFRGKDQFENSGYGMKTEEREGSPVELDISFKSNSLVAKAILAPSSSALVSDADMTSVSDTDLTSAEKRKNGLVSDSDCSDLKPAKPSIVAVSLSSSPCKANGIPNFGKDFNLQKNKSCSQPCSCIPPDHHGKNEGAQNPNRTVSDERTKVRSGKTSPRVAKKKIIVKKVVKKVVSNPNLNVSSSISSNVLDGTVQTDSVSPSFTSGSDKTETSLKDEITAVDKISTPSCLLSSPREGNLFPDYTKEDITLQSMGPHTSSQEYKTDDNSDIGHVARIKRNKNISNSSSGASSIKDEKSDSDCLDADNFVHGLHGMSNADKVVMTKSLNGNTFPDISNMDDVDVQLCQNEVSLSPGQHSNVQCLENRYHVEDDKNCRLSTSAETDINTDVINTCNSANVRVTGLIFNDLTGSIQESITDCDINNDGKVDCKSEALLLTENAILEENQETFFPVLSCGIVGLSSPGETMTQDGPKCLEHSRVPMNSSDTNSEGSMTVPHSVIVKDSAKQASPEDAALSSENCTPDQFPNSEFSVGGDTNKSKKRKVGTHSNFSSSNIRGISSDPIHTVIFENVDTTTSLRDPSPSEVLDSNVQSSDFSLQSSMGRVTDLHGKGEVSEAEVYSGNNGNNSVNRSSPISKINETATGHLNFTLCQAELSDAVVVATSCAEGPIRISDNQTHEKEVAFSSMAKLSTSPSLAYPEDSCKLFDNSLVRESTESPDANREPLNSKCSELHHLGIEYLSVHEDLAIPNDQFPVLEHGQKENATPVVPINNTQKDILVIGNTEGEKIDTHADKKCQSRDSVKIFRSADLESSDLQNKENLPLGHDCLSCPADTDGVTVSNSNTVSDLFSPGTISDVPDKWISDCQAIHKDNILGDEENAYSSSNVEHGSDLPASTLSLHHTTKNMKSDHSTGRDNLIMGKIMQQPLQVDSKVMPQGLNSSFSKFSGGKNQPGYGIPTTIQGQSFIIFPKAKTSGSSTHVSKLRTWHRTGNNSASLPRSKPSGGFVPPKKPVSEKRGNFQNTSYIRKGNNSLVRKHTADSALPQSSVNQSPSLGFDEFRKGTGSASKVDITDQTNLLKKGLTHAPLERQRTPPLPVDPILPNQMTTSSEENRSSPMIEPLSNADSDNASEPQNITEPCDALNSAEDGLKSYETVENQTVQSNTGESQVEANDGNVSSLNSKRIVYVKRKSNQLVATSNSCDLSVTDDNAQTAASDGYYKRSKNQLVRTTFESHINQTVGMLNIAVNSDGQGTQKAVCNRRFSKRRSQKVGNSCKPLRASLVWTLYGANSSKNGSNSVHRPKVLPHLFPWKRATYLRSFIYNPALSSNISSLSAIGKKLALLRKRDTVYTRSTHGFSLRKSKVLGVGGSSLKWSKSIEKSSKKANEEATRAVAAVERKKKEQKDVVRINSRAKRERIFRIGTVRYRMDPSGRTLHRISDDESLSSASIHSGLPAKRSYIPRRLVIGNDEYVRIGNGHQLIRDPKKRTRLLANEKIRWSLHTARQRLARKQKYCQFFTRFGKCNKDDRKCPYIHDPSKIAVCTKFLNGLCSTPNCKLTHKVIPERMPDCSYFLQGLCTNRNCPYRHVNVNPKASICEGFLRGYCANGNECRKKHTYVCPTFEATGICTQGTKCKLHHPQKQCKGKKRKRSGDQKNSRGRYFGSMPIDVSEPGMTVASRQGEQNNDDLEGELADYISLDVDDEEIAERSGQPSEQVTLCDSEPMDIQLDDLDEFIKPILLMKRGAQASPV